MSRYFIAALAVLLSFGATALSAETAADPKADLALLETRAKADPQLEHLLQQLRANIARGQLQSRDMRDVLMRYLPEFNRLQRDMQPFDYRQEALTYRAERRSQLLGDIMRADLDGDWQISREEAVSVVRTAHSQNIANAFLLGDADDNNLLDMAEIQASIVSMTEARSDRDGRSGSKSLQLFDLNDDGVLTLQEIDRSLAALAL